MFMIGLTLFFLFSFSARHTIATTNGSIAARFNITDNVLELTVHNYRADSLRKRDDRDNLVLAPAQEDLFTIHGVFVANVFVGDQAIPLVVDTGSVPTWVATPSFRCVDKSHQPRSTCNFGRTFDPDKSTTLRQLTTDPFETSYESDEFVMGKVFNEKISIGREHVGREIRPAFTISQVIGIAEYGYWKGDFISGGVLGLALPMQPDHLSILQTLFQDTSIDPVFSLALARPAMSGGPMGGGYLAFGGIPHVPIHEDSWVTTPILAPLPDALGLLVIGIDGFDVTPPVGSSHTPQNEEVDPFISRRLIMGVDSGTTYIQAPPDIVEHIAKLFSPPAQLNPHKNLWTMKCDTLAPTVGIKIRGKLYNISPEDLVTPAPSLGEDMCKLAIEPTMSMYDWILGVTWLRNVLVVFDFTSVGKGRGNGNSISYGDLHIARR